MSDICACGHTVDEHEPECTVEDCPCVHFDADEDSGDLE